MGLCGAACSLLLLLAAVPLVTGSDAEGPLLPVTFEPLAEPAALADSELVAPPAALDRCRCQQACAARPACLSAGHCPGPPAVCRLYGRRGNTSTWEWPAADCVLLLRTQAARLTDHCAADADCDRLAPGAVCLSAVCGCAPPLLAEGEQCVAAPPPPSAVTVPCDPLNGTAQCPPGTLAVGLVTKKPEQGSPIAPLLQLVCLPVQLQANASGERNLTNQAKDTKTYEFVDEQAVVRSISIEEGCLGAPLVVTALAAAQPLGPPRTVTLTANKPLPQLISCHSAVGEVMTGVRWIDGRDDKIELTCRQLPPTPSDG
ncbi:hypothetical protein FJT64_003582 [Amphibalanus amphitrite]|uniref:Uncharacterized protein n=1 Tax=Amphibalanus amphitrite TaxID=1232801 RepID=A0A6A4VY68_AMPAM|nr:hypothetical protein FJT64_003582 [Amphibalanus amphitrite]